MAPRKILRQIHLAATVWFMLCVAYLVAVGLRRTGLRWWLVFSLSGYSAGMIFLLASLYLFALYHGIGGARRTTVRHPVTGAGWYMGLYVSAPLIGGLVGLLGMADPHGIHLSWFHAAMGTLKTTCLAWIVIDPLIGMIEILSSPGQERLDPQIPQPAAVGDATSRRRGRRGG